MPGDKLCAAVLELGDLGPALTTLRHRNNEFFREVREFSSADEAIEAMAPCPAIRHDDGAIHIAGPPSHVELAHSVNGASMIRMYFSEDMRSTSQVSVVADHATCLKTLLVALRLAHSGKLPQPNETQGHGILGSNLARICELLRQPQAKDLRC